MKFFNHTAHDITIFDKSCYISKGRHSNQYTLREGIEPVILFQIPPNGNVLNIQEHSEEVEVQQGVSIAHPIIQTISYDQVQGFFDPDGIYVVSRKYAAYVNSFYYPTLADSFYYPYHLVTQDREEGNKVLGCLTLQKATPYQMPSSYITAIRNNAFINFIAVDCALKFWFSRCSQLPLNELQALYAVKEFMERRWSSCQ